MYSLTVSEMLVGSHYRSGSRNLEGKIIYAEKVDYSDNYKIEVESETYPRNQFWATVEVTAG
jgi:hypothetical protein